MTPEQLKASILQYAMQGKLVEQRSEEGTAEELYLQIQEKKKELIKAKKIKKEKTIAPLTDDVIPFDIPESWVWCRLSEVIDVRDGTHDSPKYVPEGIPLVTSKNLSNGTIDFGNIKYITQKDADKINERSAVDNDDILFAMIGSIGNPVLVKKDREFCIKNMALFKKYADTNINMNYMYWFFFLVQYSLKAEASGGVQSFISLSRFREYPVPLPPFEEQHRIASKIEELLPYIDRYAKSYEKLEQSNVKFPEDMKKSILQYAIQGKLVEQRPEEGTAEELYQQIQEEKQKLNKDKRIKKEKLLAEIAEDEIPFDIPESWKWVRLGQIINFQGGYAFKSTAYVQSSKNQVIRLGNVKNNNLLIHEKEVFVDDELAKIASDYKLKENDILVSMTGTRRKKDYFFTLIVRKDDLKERNLYLNQRVGCFRAMPGIDVEYLLAVLQNEAIKNIIFLKETGTANQGNLGSEDMKEFVYIPLPPLNEQHRIVAKLKELLPYCDRLVK